MGSRVFGGSLLTRARLGLVALATLTIWALLVAPASADRLFDDRFSTNDTGDIEIAANAVLSCSTTLQSNCADVRSNTGTTTTYNNNNFQMQYLDVDSDGSTFNSSSADLNLPTGSTVLFAGLYWGGQLNSGGTSGGGGSNAANRGPAPTPADNDVVLLDAPGAGGYSTINGTTDNGSGSQSQRYGGFANVTSQVAAAGNGTYTVANVQTGRGSDVFGGWSLVVAYRDTSQPARNLTIFDGLESIATGAGNDSQENISVSGFLTPPTGPVQTTLGLVAYEGDFATSGDFAELNNTVISDPLNPGGATASERNTFNSTIGQFGTRVTTKNPDYVNQLGYDADLISANGILANNATSAVIGVETTGDAYLPAVATFATELFAPDIQPVKTAADVNGGELEHGDEIEYTVRMTNSGDDAAAGVILRDQIPAGTTYVPGSLEIDAVTSGASCSGTFAGRTDAEDADTAHFDDANNRTVFHMGDGATGSAGGTLDPDDTQCARFRVSVNDDTLPDFQIENAAEADYRSATLGTAFVGVASNETTDTVTAPDLSVTKTHSGGPFVGGQSYDFEIQVANFGNADTDGPITITDDFPASSFASINSIDGPPGLDCSASSGLTVDCTYPGPIQQDSAITVLVNATLVGSPPATISNTACVSGGGDTNQANDCGTDSAGASAEADLAITKVANPSTVFAGDDTTFELEVENLGPSTASDVQLQDVLAPNFTAVSATPSQGTCDSNVDCDLNSLASGDSATITIVATANDSAAGSTVTNTATVTDNGGSTDPVQGNNIAEADVTVPLTADLALTKDFSPPSPEAGNPVTWTIEVTNNGPDPATNATVVDTIPAEIADSPTPTATIEGGSCSLDAGPPRTITCTVASLANGDSATMEVTGTLLSNSGGKTVRNSATVSADEADRNVDNNVDSAAFQPLPFADLDVVKTGPAGPVQVGDTYSYTLQAQNLGPSDAYGVDLVDTLPAGLQFVSSNNPDCAAAGQVVTCPLGTPDAGQGNERVFGPGDSETFTITVEVLSAAAAGPSVTNQVELEQNPDDPTNFPPTPDPVLENNSDEFTTTVDQAADLSITKTADPDPVAAGEDVTYTLTVANDGPSTATSVEVGDDLPASLTLVSATPDQGSCNATDPVDCNLGDIGPGGSVEIEIVATVGAGQAGQQISNTASVDSPVEDPDPDDNEDTTTVGVEPEADLAITKVAGPGPLFAGDDVTYTLTVTNGGPNTATGVEVSDDLPASLTLVSATPDQGTCNAADPVDCDLGSITSGESAEIEIVATIAADQSGNQIANTASVAAAEEDPDETNNSDEETIGVEPEADLSITKTADPDPVAAGENVTYTLTVANDGPSTATSVEVGDDLPASLTLVSATPDQGSCSATDPVDCDLGSIASGESAEVEIVATVGADQTGQQIANTATVQGDEEDPDPGDNEDTTTVEVAPEADLSVTKRVSPNRAVRVGEPLTYTLTVQNAGPNDATDVAVTDELGRNAALISASPSQGSCAVTEPIECDLGTIANGGSAEVMVEVRPLDRGRLVNGASVTSAMADPDESDNEDDVATRIRRARVRVDKVANARRAEPGDIVRYKIRVRSSSPVRLENLRVCDRVPRALELIGAPGARIKGGKACWRFDLAAGATRTFKVRAKVKSVEHELKVVNTARLKGPDVESAQGRDSVRVEGEPDSGVGPGPCPSVRGLRC